MTGATDLCYACGRRAVTTLFDAETGASHRICRACRAAVLEGARRVAEGKSRFEPIETGATFDDVREVARLEPGTCRQCERRGEVVRVVLRFRAVNMPAFQVCAECLYDLTAATQVAGSLATLYLETEAGPYERVGVRPS